jgi:hypothetical protein
MCTIPTTVNARDCKSACDRIVSYPQELNVARTGPAARHASPVERAPGLTSRIDASDTTGGAGWIEVAQRGLTPIYPIIRPTTDCEGCVSSQGHPQLIHRFFHKGGHESEGRLILMPSAWTLSRIEAVIFIATVVLTAGAGTWLTVGAR